MKIVYNKTTEEEVNFKKVKLPPPEQTVDKYLKQHIVDVF